MMELTDKMIEAMADCNPSECKTCDASRFCDYSMSEFTRQMAKALQAERAKPKDDLWKGAPIWATHTRRVWFKPMENEVYSEIITRELPKTRADELAEELAIEIGNMVGGETFVPRAGKRIKETILKAQAEWEAGR